MGKNNLASVEKELGGDKKCPHECQQTQEWWSCQDGGRCGRKMSFQLKSNMKY